MKELLKKDIQLQWRQGFWLVYFVICIIYVIVLLSIPRASREFVSLYLILSDTTILGVVFIGALILLEKQQGVLHAFFVTPLTPGAYLLSKTLSLTLIAVSMSILVYLPVWKFGGTTLLLFLTVALTAWIFTLLGLGIAAGVHTINQYFGTLIGVSILIAGPEVPYLLLDRHPAFLCLPNVASIDLMFGTLQGLPAWRILTDLTVLAGWTLLAYLFCRRRVIRFLVLAS